MKLYYFPASSNSRRVLAVAYHLGIELELEALQLFKGEHLKPEFVRLNPNHKIPTLVDEDFILWESAAIILYLVGKKPGNKLYSTNLREQADINRWLFWNAAHWSQACGIYVYEYLIKKHTNQGDPDTAELKRADGLFHHFAKVLDDHLKDQQWLSGDRLTVADYAVGSILMQADKVHFPVEEYKEIIRWYGDIEKQDAWKKSAPENFM